MKFPPEKMIDLYEQIVKEMIEAREIDTARALLRSTVPLAMMREEDGDRWVIWLVPRLLSPIDSFGSGSIRYTRLERLLSRPIYEDSEAYPDGSNKHDRRRDIADSLKEHVLVAPPSRLVSIIGHSLKWQQHLV
jgi:WD40 repeat-containing protein SMU1